MTYLHYYYYMYIATLVHVEKGSFWWGYFEMDHSYLTNGSISKLIRLLGTLSIIYNTENNIMLCPAEASLLRIFFVYKEQQPYFDEEKRAGKYYLGIWLGQKINPTFTTTNLFQGFSDLLLYLFNMFHVYFLFFIIHHLL